MRFVSKAPVRGAMNRACRISLLGVLIGAFIAPAAQAGDIDPVFNPARLSPSLDGGSASAFRFASAVATADAGTHEANAFSHFHFDEKAKSEQLALAFERAEKRNAIDARQVARQLAKARSAPAAKAPVVAAKPVDEASRRIAAAFGAPAADETMVLAYASAAPVEENKPLAAIAAVAPIDEDANLAALPDSAPLPGVRPKFKPLVVQEDEPDKPGERNVVEEPAKPDESKQAARPAKPEVQVREKPQMAAMVRPDSPNANSDKSSGFGQSLRNLFGGKAGARAGNGVAVYDISAAKVYMPD
ncbi:hypothetical protein BZU93_30295, partial [Salmonella enterica subsp. enterica]|nr:hypothetical protein [Salmonella enterica subsp. enterica serovar Enteritidis]